MIALICFVLAVLASPFKSKSRLEAENAALRHQLIVLRRTMPGRPWLTNNDRWFFLQMYRWFPSILKVVRIIRKIPNLTAFIDRRITGRAMRGRATAPAEIACEDAFFAHTAI